MARSTTNPDTAVNASGAIHAASMRRLVERGLQALRERDGAVALDCFQRANAVATRYRLGTEAQAGTLFNLALAYRLIGALDEAAGVLRRLLDVHGLGPEQLGMAWNALGSVHAEQNRFRVAARCFYRAIRVLRRRRHAAHLRAEAAGNLATVLIELGKPRRALKWAARAMGHARHAGPFHRQFAALQLIGAHLALGQTGRAAKGIAQLKRSILPEHASLFWRLHADLCHRAGDIRQAVALAARSLDAAVCDLSAEDIATATRVFARYRGCGAVEKRAQLLAAYARSHRPWIAAFTTACQQLDLARERQVVALLVAGDGTILTRAGGEEILDKLALTGVHVGARLEPPTAGSSLPGPHGAPAGGHREVEPSGRWAWAQLMGEEASIATPFGAHAPHGRTMRSAVPPAWVCVWPPQPAMARAIAVLASRIREAAVQEQQQREQAQAVAKLAAFHQAAVALGRPLPTPELIARLLALAQQVSRSDGVALVFTEGRRGVWADGLDGDGVRRMRSYRRVAATGRPVRLSIHRSRDREDLARLGLASLLLVPVIVGGDRCWAVLAAGRIAGPDYTEAELELVTFVSRQFGLALENAALRDDLSQRLMALTRDLELARRLQEAFLPLRAVRHGPLRVAGVTLPAKFVGGDLYDYVRLRDGTWALALGDVMGKGAAAAMLATMLLSRLRELWGRQAPDAELIRRLDVRVTPDLRRGRALATLLLAACDPQGGTLRAWLAGHDGPVLWQGGRWRALHRGGGTALGLSPGSGSVVEVEVRLGAGDVVLFYSDGLGDLLVGRRGAGRACHVAAALDRLGLQPRRDRPEAMLGRIRALARTRTVEDDVTVVMLGVANANGAS